MFLTPLIENDQNIKHGFVHHIVMQPLENQPENCLKFQKLD